MKDKNADEERQIMEDMAIMLMDIFMLSVDQRNPDDGKKIMDLLERYAANKDK